MIAEVFLPVPIDKPFDYCIPHQYAGLLKDELIGRRVKLVFGRRLAVGVIASLKDQSETPSNKLKHFLELLDPEPILTSEALRLGNWLADRYLCPRGEALFSLMPPGRSGRISFRDPEPVSDFEPGFPLSQELTLTSDQKKAADLIHECLHQHESKKILLMGGAATGKTEVYIAAIEDAVKQGKGALILAPEIGLANQIVDLLKNRFGEASVLLWVSDEKVKKRVDDWWRIKKGEFPIVVGARSAVLAPLPHIGLIIVDEEQDSAYKEDRKPRFHARDVASFRADEHHATVLFGTATPSLEMMENVQKGDVLFLELTERAVAASAPLVRLIDLSKEKKRGVISDPLHREMDMRLKKGEQTILFLNKRGFHRFLKCPECDWVARCPNCSIALVYHKADLHKGYVCHYCSYLTQMPSQCPECGHKKLFAGGFGTQRVAEEVSAMFPWARILRWDRDSALKKGTHRKNYEAFQKGEFDILIGTQLVTQGFHFPKVTLVGVVDADSPLFLSDFRAAEKTFQHLTQVAGRAGRAMVAGEVLLQTRHPEHYVLKKAAIMDYKGFVEEEMKLRHEFHYPPATHLIRILTSSKSKDAEKNMENLTNWIEKENFSGLFLLGPNPLKKTEKGKAQFQILVKVPGVLLSQFLEKIRPLILDPRFKFMTYVD